MLQNDLFFHKAFLIYAQVILQGLFFLHVNKYVCMHFIPLSFSLLYFKSVDQYYPLQENDNSKTKNYETNNNK